ncbi:MAG: GIY-YIG nuclease family protein [Patescibacteria group bacterium]
MKFTYVYVLQSSRDGNFYAGMTNDLRRRLYGHQSGNNISTAKRLPVI